MSIINVKFVKDSNPIYLKNQRPALGSKILTLDDVQNDNPINNSVLIYNESDDKFHVDQLSLDGGAF
jgi:hypothetical protein